MSMLRYSEVARSLRVVLCLLLPCVGLGCGGRSLNGPADRPPPAPGVLLAYRCDGRVGFLGKDGDVRVPARFDAVDASRALAPVGVRMGKKHSFVDAAGRVISPFQFDDAGRFACGLAAVSIGGTWGYINVAGEMVIPPRFLSAESFSVTDSLALVRLSNGRRAYISTDGRVAVELECRFTVAKSFSEGLAFVADIDAIMLADPIKVPLTFRPSAPGQAGYIDTKGKMVIDLSKCGVDVPVLGGGGQFRNGLACVQRDRRYGFIDRTGRMVIAPKYDYAHEFSEGVLSVRMRGKGDDRRLFGYVNTKGHVVIPARYVSAGRFANGMAKIMGDNSLYGYITTDGTLAIPPVFVRAGDFNRAGVALVAKKGQEEWYIDKSGRRVGKRVHTASLK